jgi:hypothetical protein
MDNTTLTDKALPHLKQMKALKFLAIGGTDITVEGAADLQKALPELRIRK